MCPLGDLKGFLSQFWRILHSRPYPSDPRGHFPSVLPSSSGSPVHPPFLQPLSLFLLGPHRFIPGDTHRTHISFSQSSAPGGGGHSHRLRTFPFDFPTQLKCWDLGFRVCESRLFTAVPQCVLSQCAHTRAFTCTRTPHSVNMHTPHMDTQTGTHKGTYTHTCTRVCNNPHCPHTHAPGHTQGCAQTWGIDMGAPGPRGRDGASDSPRPEEKALTDSSHGLPSRRWHQL